MKLKNRKDRIRLDRLARFAKDYQPGNPIKPNFKFRAEDPVIPFDEASKIMDGPVGRKFFGGCAKVVNVLDWLNEHDVQYLTNLNNRIISARRRGNVLTFLEMPADRHGFPFEGIVDETEKFLECNSIDPDSDPC
jgi:hypothetical protein